MTREEAVEVLKERYLTCVGIGLDNHANRVNEAIDMAIEALHREEAEAKGYCHRINYIPKPCENANCDCVEVVRCKDCKHWHSNTEFCGIWSFQNIAQRTLSDDYCSRAERREE